MYHNINNTRFSQANLIGKERDFESRINPNEKFDSIMSQFLGKVINRLPKEYQSLIKKYLQ